MTTREIIRAQRPIELDQFSRMHRGQRVTVHTSGPQFGVQLNAKNLPLLGTTAQRRENNRYEIQVMVGESPDMLVPRRTAESFNHP